MLSLLTSTKQSLMMPEEVCKREAHVLSSSSQGTIYTFWFLTQLDDKKVLLMATAVNIQLL